MSARIPVSDIHSLELAPAEAKRSSAFWKGVLVFHDPDNFQLQLTAPHG